MIKQRAFTLIELLIYLALLVGLALLTFSFSARTYRFMLERTQANHLFVRAMVSGDLIRRDVQIASPWPSDWDALRGSFKQLTMDAKGKPIERLVGYEVKSNGLFRREGISIFLVDSHVTKIVFKPIMGVGKTIVAVTVLLTHKPAQVHPEPIIVALRNRVLL